MAQIPLYWNLAKQKQPFELLTSKDILKNQFKVFCDSASTVGIIWKADNDICMYMYMIYFSTYTMLLEQP